MKAAVFCIGTELVRGEIVNTNAAWLGTQLSEAGLEVTTHISVDDDRERISSTLDALARGHDVVVCTGGLGPTTDDLTAESVAKLLGVQLQRDPESLETIRERMRRRGRPMAPSNEKQADFPVGARVLPNAEGTAPGFRVEIGDAVAFFLPGVPREMKAMVEARVLPELTVPRSLDQVRVRTFGLPESAVNDRLDGIEQEHDVILAYRAHFPEIEVKVRALGTDASTRARAGADEVRRRLGDVVFAEGDTTLAEAVGAVLQDRGLMLGTAESCTGGLVARLLTERGGSSRFFAGSVVSYTNDIKERTLGVAASTLSEHGAVSEPVARAMAEGLKRHLGVDVAISLTGVAGPGGGTHTKPVGLVHYAVASPETVVARHRVFSGDRGQIRRRSAFSALDLARRVLIDALDE